MDNKLKAKLFHQMHQPPSMFVLPNAWDAISAKVFEENGFKAIGTTSAGIAASLGYKDGQNIPVNKMVQVIENISKSVDIPVSADIEAGYGQTTAEVLKTVMKVIKAGAVGINIEDGTGNPKHPISDLPLQKEKIAAIKKLSESNDFPLFINARVDTYWLKTGDPSTRFQETIKRAKVYKEAGAHCIFIPGVSDIEIIQNLKKELSSPINLLIDSNTPPLDTLSKIGIKRLSSGSSPFRSTITLLKTMSEEILNDRTFHYMIDNVVSYGEMDEFMNKEGT